MLNAIPFFADAAEIVYSYPEFFDGSGYPRRLKGEQIPLGARILSVARAVTEFTNPYYRPRAQQTVASARAELQLQSGHRLDPEVVNAVLSMPDGIWKDLRKDTRSH